jgi:ribosomal RNA assembly protein
METVLVTEERKAAVIGKDGRTKSQIERATHTRISVTDFVSIEGEPIDVLMAVNIVTAISRGFSPKDAMLLMDEEYGLDIISLKGETKKSEKRLMARVIGSGGASKKVIQEETGAKLSIYGKTVSIIGKPDEISSAREAVELLLKGKTHAYVFKRLKGED